MTEYQNFTNIIFALFLQAAIVVCIVSAQFAKDKTSRTNFTKSKRRMDLQHRHRNSL
jgi:hypothetical protein